MKKIIGLVALLLCVCLSGCGSTKTEMVKSTELCVSAAASLTDVMQELAADYERQNPEVKLTFSFGSSGALQTQIQEGAPADVFISAAQKQMDALEKQQLIDSSSRIDLLENSVVLITKRGSKATAADFKALGELSGVKIALGEPKAVPVGQYSQEIFTKLGLWDKIQPMAVYASDVRQVLGWVESGDAEYGVVYATDAAISDGVTVVAEAAKGLHKPVIYPAALLSSSKNGEAGRKFMQYLQSDEAGKIFAKYGFKRH